MDGLAQGQRLSSRVCMAAVSGTRLCVDDEMSTSESAASHRWLAPVRTALPYLRPMCLRVAGPGIPLLIHCHLGGCSGQRTSWQIGRCQNQSLVSIPASYQLGLGQLVIFRIRLVMRENPLSFDTEHCAVTSWRCGHGVTCD
jgi:hypothetical protein